MKKNFMPYPAGLESFCKNIDMCRKVVYGLTYRDVTSYIGLPESTMITYDTKGVSPYITVAKQIADMYVTTIERLCEDEIYFDIEEVLNLQINFINRIGGIPVKLYKEKLVNELMPFKMISKYYVCKEISNTFKTMISDIHRFNKYVKIEKDENIVNNISRNFHNLHENLKVSYRTILKVTGISIGSLTRIEQGFEPMLAPIIRLCEYFGINITEMLSENPDFDYEKIKKEIKNKKELPNVRKSVSLAKEKRQSKLNMDLLMNDEIEKYITKWLNKID